MKLLYELSNIIVSCTGSAMLQAIAIGLLWLKDSLASTVFVKAWENLAAQVNEVLVLPFPYSE